MTVFMDFRPFFDAMVKEMRRHDSEKEDSWKERGFYDGSGRSVEDKGRWWPMDVYLDERIVKKTREYKDLATDENGNYAGARGNFFILNENVDIANFHAMRWLRHYRGFI